MSGYFSNLREEIDILLPENIDTLMDIGCGTGVTACWIKQKYGCRAIGVELDVESAGEASKVLDVVYQADIEEGIECYSDFTGRVDVILLLDILEHIKDPWQQLEELKKLLSAKGVVIASIPNVRNFKVLAPLLFCGNWNYQQSGVLDRTHLRFFTKKTTQALFEERGFIVESIISTGPVSMSQVRSKLGLAMYLLNIICFGRLEGFITHQYIIRASEPKDHP